MEYESPKEEYIMSPADSSGKGITLEKLAGKWKGYKGCSLKNLKRKCAKEEWRKLREEFWEEALDAKHKKDARDLGETVSEAKQRYIRIVQAAIGKFVEAMKEEKLSYSLSDIDKLARLELLLRGEPTERKEIRGVMEVNVSILETVVADVIRELLAENAINRQAARKFADRFANGINCASFLYEVPEDSAQKFASEMGLAPKKVSKHLQNGPKNN